MDLNEYVPSKRTKAIIFGPPKCGKTALVGELAAHDFTLHWVDCEKGISTLLNPKMLPPEFRKNVKVINLPDHRLYPIAIETVNDIFRGGPMKICWDHGKNRCALCTKAEKEGGTPKWSHEFDLANFGDKDILVIDSWTQVSLSAMNKATLTQIKGVGGDEYKYEFDDYRRQASKLEGPLSKIQSCDINIIVISHQLDAEKSESSTYLVPQGGTRNASLVLAKYFDEVIYMNKMNKKHRAYSSSTAFTNVMTGGRSGVQLDEAKELSLVDIFKR